jgi:hypothetical protein
MFAASRLNFLPGQVQMAAEMKSEAAAACNHRVEEGFSIFLGQPTRRLVRHQYSRIY